LIPGASPEDDVRHPAIWLAGTRRNTGKFIGKILTIGVAPWDQNGDCKVAVRDNEQERAITRNLAAVPDCGVAISSPQDQRAEPVRAVAGGRHLLHGISCQQPSAVQVVAPVREG
jgi:hypothetical protein